MKRSLLLPAYFIVGLAFILFSVDPVMGQKTEEGGRVDTIIERDGSSAQQAELLYVSNQGEATVAVIDMNTNEQVTTVDLQELGFSSNAKPHHVTAEPDGSAWYVSLIGGNSVLKFNRDNELIGRFEFETPGMLALHPTEDLLYVARSMSAVNPPHSIGVANRATMGELQEIDTFFPRPHAVAVTADGRFVYTASLATNQIMGIDTEQQRGELTTIDGETQVFVQFGVTPDGETVIAGGQTTGQLLILSAQGDGTLELEETVTVGAQPWHPTIDHEGRYAYVPNKESNTVSVLDLNSRQVVDTIEDESFAQPHGSALSADGRYLYISNNNNLENLEVMSDGDVAQDEPEDDRGSVSVIDLESREVVDVIRVGEYPTGIGTRAWQ